MTRRSKFNAKPQVVDGVRFDSLREFVRWRELQLLEQAGAVSQLERQVPYQLAPAVKMAGEKRTKPALRYIADFRYFNRDLGCFIVEDAKGRDTPVSRIKRHLMKSVHGIDVRLS